MSNLSTQPRHIVGRTKGHGTGLITRLMSPSDLGQQLKPFVFLDIFNAEGAGISAMGRMPIHPHSGIATVTVFTQGAMQYHDPMIGSGILEYGGVEWMQSGRGVWHGKELSAAPVSQIQGFQLWLALPKHLELSDPVSRYIEATTMVQSGPAHIIVGQYEGKQSPVPAPQGINYLLVTLQPNESWRYQPPEGHTVAWLAVAQGELLAEDKISTGEMVIFETGEQAITLRATDQQKAIFVLGSAIPHPDELYLGNYSVHTSVQALKEGEQHIRELAKAMQTVGNRKTATGTVPVFR